MKKLSRKVCLLLVALMVLTALAGCGGAQKATEGSTAAATTAASTTAAATTASSEKVTLVGIAYATDWSWADKFLKKVQDHFPNYNFVFKSFDAANIDKILKTMISAGNPPNFSDYWPTFIANYVRAGMVTDLTPYVSANNNEWANTFTEAGLRACTLDGKTYMVPIQGVYPMLVVNKDLTDKAGVTVPENGWTWEEFMQANKTIKEKLGGEGVYPFAIPYDWACWLNRNGMISNWDSKEKGIDFSKGKISFLEPNIVEVFDNSKAVYTNNYAYPGKGAIAVKLDEIWAAFKAGKIAMVADVNCLATNHMKTAGVPNAYIASMPHMGPLDLMNGATDGYFIPTNATHINETVEVLKYMTSKECMQIAADAGAAVLVKGIEGMDEKVTKDTAKIGGYEIITLSSEFFDILVNKMPADYINKGKSSLEKLEEMRLKYLKDNPAKE